MQVREAEALGAIDEDRVRGRDVEADSTIAVDTSTSASRSTNSSIARSSSRSSICPCPTTNRASGTSSLSSATESMSCTRLCTKKTCPPRLISRRIGSVDRALVVFDDVRQDRMPVRGRVPISDRSRIPSSDRCSVRGIGVAESVSVHVAAEA